MGAAMKTIGVIGAGQLGLMLAEEAHKLGARVVTLDPAADAPAARVADGHIVAVPDFEGGLYGQKVTVELLDYIAESRRFESTGQLRAAVMAWAGEARRWFDRRDREMGETLL